MPSNSRVLKVETQVRDAIVSLEHLLSPADTYSKGYGRNTVLADLIRRAEASVRPDGFPPGGNAEHVAGSGGGDPVLSVVSARLEDVCDLCEGRGSTTRLHDDGSTSEAACRRCEGSGRRWADPVGDAVAELLHQVSEIRRACRVVDRKRFAVLGVEQKARKVRLPDLCAACEKEVSGIGNDRLRNRFCRSCFLKWGSWKLKHQSGDPAADRRRFEAEIRALLK